MSRPVESHCYLEESSIPLAGTNWETILFNCLLDHASGIDGWLIQEQGSCSKQNVHLVAGVYGGCMVMPSYGMLPTPKNEARPAIVVWTVRAQHGPRSIAVIVCCSSSMLI